MNGAQILDISREAVWTTILIGGPIMAVALIVGFTISLFQALTQVQEMTLSFVPKIVSIFVAMILLLPFMGNTLETFATALYDHIAQVGHDGRL